MPDKRRIHSRRSSRSNWALLLIDVINPLEFPEAPQLQAFVPGMTRVLRRLKERARRAGVPILYVNDNFGRWRSDLRQQVRYCQDSKSRGAKMTQRLQPDDEDYFVLKPKHSGFFGTALEMLLRSLGTRYLILTGIAGTSCILATAIDAHMRDYRLFVPRDGTISNTASENRAALKLMRDYLEADIRPAAKITFRSSRNRGDKRTSFRRLTSRAFGEENLSRFGIQRRQKFLN
jgi:nicotinamidase-related amidase